MKESTYIFRLTVCEHDDGSFSSVVSVPRSLATMDTEFGTPFRRVPRSMVNDALEVVGDHFTVNRLGLAK